MQGFKGAKKKTFLQLQKSHHSYTIRFIFTVQGPVSRKSRNFTGHFRMSQFPLYLNNGENLSRQTSKSFFSFLFVTVKTC